MSSKNIPILHEMEQHMQNENKENKSNEIGFTIEQNMHDQYVEGIHSYGYEFSKFSKH